VLGALLSRPDPELAQIVHHAQAGGRRDVLARYGPGAAADAARTGAHRQAAETLRLVIEAGVEQDPAQLSRLFSARAYSLYAVNRFEDAFACASEAVRRAEPSGDPVLLADALSVLSKTGFWARGPLAARRASSLAVASLEDAGDEVRLAAALTDLARAHSNLATLGIVGEPGTAAVRFAERAVALADRLGRDDLRAQALVYLGSGRLADGDDRGAADLDRAIRLASADPHVEFGVRACVNAAGSAYRRGRFADAEEYVTQGLRLADHGEFFGGEYRLRLTRASVQASSGRWDDAIGGLRDLLAVAGDPAAMGVLARALLARLLGRRGDARAAAEALGGAASFAGGPEDVFIAGPLAAAATELAWLQGDTAAMPALSSEALSRAAEAGHRGSRSELCRYLQRGGHAVDPPADPTGPWVPALAGRCLESAAAWAALGERYEEAVELSLAGDAAARLRGLRALDRLGAAATLAALRRTEVPVPRSGRQERSSLGAGASS
jgi:tetratricopeptide (TPR) repeat protein